MANENQEAFNILGRVAVDLAALDASLRAAEAKVAASTNRQAKSYESFAVRAKKAAHDAAMKSAVIQMGGQGAYQLKHGTEEAGAAASTGKRIAGQAKDIVAAAGRVTHASGQMGHAVKNLLNVSLAFVPGAGYVRQHLNMMSGGLLSGTKAMTGFGIALGAATGLVAVAGMALSHYVQDANAVFHAQLSLNRAVATLDVGRAEAAYTTASEAAEVYAARANDAAYPTSVMSNLISSSAVIWNHWTGAVEKNAAAMEKAATAVRLLHTLVILPKSALDLERVHTSLLEDKGRTAIATASSIKKMREGYVELAEAQKQTTAQEIESARLVAQADTAKNPAAILEIGKVYEDKVAGINARAAQTKKKTAREEIVTFAQVTSADDAFTASIMETQAKRAHSYEEEAASFKSAHVFKRAALVDLIAADVDAVKNKRALRLLDEQEQDAIGARANAQVKAMAAEATAAVASAMQRRKASTDTRDLVLKQEAEMAQMTADRGGRGVDVQALVDEQQRVGVAAVASLDAEKAALVATSAIRRAELEKAISLGQNVIQNREALVRLEDEHQTKMQGLGERGAQEQMTRERANLKERVAAYDKLRALEEERAGQVAKLTNTSLSVELKRVQGVLATMTSGTDEWWKQMVKVHDAAKNIHDTMKGTYTTIRGIGEKRLADQGITEATDDQIAAAAEEQRREDQANINTSGPLAHGVKTSAINRLGAFRQYDKESGGNLSQAAHYAQSDPNRVYNVVGPDGSLGPPPALPNSTTPDPRSAMTAVASLTGAAAGSKTTPGGPGGEMASQWDSALKSVDGLVDTFIAATKGKLGTLGSDLGKIVGQTATEAVSRAMYLEVKRGPVTTSYSDGTVRS